MRKTLCALVSAAALAVSSITFAADAPATQPKKQVEVCFVLDTTGSMGGLIDGA